jgi:UDP-N-acetylmuramoyl-tripeptide--D-alanyl-D-alanine ligase
VAVLGSMLELGPEGGALHRRVLSDVLARDLDLVVATGQFARAARELEARGGDAGTELLAADEPEAGYERLRERLQGGEIVLLKASRGVALERLLPRFRADFAAVEEG